MQTLTIYIAMILAALFATGDSETGSGSTISALEQSNYESPQVPDLLPVDLVENNGQVPVPEPSSMLLLGGLLTGLFGYRKKFSRS